MRNPTLSEWGEVQGLERAKLLAQRAYEVAAAALALRVAEIQGACDAHPSFQMTRDIGTETIRWATREGHVVGPDGKLMVTPSPVNPPTHTKQRNSRPEAR